MHLYMYWEFICLRIVKHRNYILDYQLCHIFIINNYVSIYIINSLVFQYKSNVFFEAGNHLDERLSLM